MPSHLHAERPASQPPERGALDALITQTRHLRGGIDAVRPRPAPESGDGMDDSTSRWQRALCDLAAHHLDDLGGHLDQLRAAAPGEHAGASAAGGQEQAGAPHA
ncbi:MAG: phosphatase, partial [Streptomyces sp.]